MNNVLLLSILIYFLQGIEQLPLQSISFYLKETLGLQPQQLMNIIGLASLAWLIKPLFGILIDNYFTKQKWIAISLIISITIAICFILCVKLLVPILIILLLFSGYGAATRDIAIDGLACIEGKNNNITEKIQSYQWISCTVAGILVGICGGYIAEHFNYKIGFLCLIPFYVLILWVNSRNKKTLDLNNKQSFFQHLKSYRELFSNKKFLAACLFLFLYKYSPSFGTALWYVERDTFHWSKIFLGTLDTVFNCASLLGAFLFYRYGKNIDTHKFLFYSVFIGAITSLSYLWFTPVTAIVYGIIYNIIGMGIHLAIMSWMAKNSLPGKESTSFALMCAISNTAATASVFSGAKLLTLIGLNGLIILSSITSFLCLPLLFKLRLKNNT